MVAEAGLELKEEQSSRNERQKHITQKTARKDFGDNLLSRACASSTASAARTTTNTLIMTLDTSLRSRHQVDQAEEEDMLPSSSCKALAHMCFANRIGRAVRKHSLLKKSQRALWKRCSGTLRGNSGSCRWLRGPAKQGLPSHCSRSAGAPGAWQRAAGNSRPATNVLGHTHLKKGIWWSEMGVGRSAD